MSSERLVMTNDTQDTGDNNKIQILNKMFMVVGWQTNQLMDREKRQAEGYLCREHNEAK